MTDPIWCLSASWRRGGRRSLLGSPSARRVSRTRVCFKSAHLPIAVPLYLPRVLGLDAVGSDRLHVDQYTRDVSPRPSADRAPPHPGARPAPPEPDTRVQTASESAGGTADESQGTRMQRTSAVRTRARGRAHRGAPHSADARRPQSPVPAPARQSGTRRTTDAQTRYRVDVRSQMRARNLHDLEYILNGVQPYEKRTSSNTVEMRSETRHRAQARTEGTLARIPYTGCAVRRAVNRYEATYYISSPSSLRTPTNPKEIPCCHGEEL